MYGHIEAINEIKKALNGTNITYDEIYNLAGMMVFEHSKSYVVVEFLHDCGRISDIQLDRLHEIIENCEHLDD